MSQAHEMTVPVLLGYYVNISNQATVLQQRVQQLAAENKKLQAELDERRPKPDDSVPEEGPAA